MIAGHVKRLVARLVLVAFLATVGPMHTRAQSGDQLADLRAQVSRLYDQGKYADAVAIAERYVALAREKYGQDDTEYATAISWLAYVYRAQRRYTESAGLILEYRKDETLPVCSPHAVTNQRSLPYAQVAA